MIRPSCVLRLALLALLIASGCQTPSHPSAPKDAAPATPPKPIVGAKPLIDFARGAGGFPLGSDSLPKSREKFVAALTAGYRERVAIDPKFSPVIADGDQYPNLDSLVIDLTGGSIKADYRPAAFKAVGALKADALRVGYLSYTATPLRYVDGSTNLRITAHDVQLGLLRGHGEQAALVMTEAHDGHVTFDVTLADLQSMFLASAKSSGSHGGYSVDDIQLSLTSSDSRDLACELRVKSAWLLVPTSFKITGRIDIDDEFNAHLSNVACSGEDVGGVLVAAFIDAALKKYDGKVIPVASFPGGHIRIRQLHITVDDALRLRVSFSS